MEVIYMESKSDIAQGVGAEGKWGGFKRQNEGSLWGMEMFYTLIVSMSIS